MNIKSVIVGTSLSGFEIGMQAQVLYHTHDSAWEASRKGDQHGNNIIQLQNTIVSFSQRVRALIYKIRRSRSHLATKSCNSRHSSGFAPCLESYFIPLRSFVTDDVSAEAMRIGYREGCETIRQWGDGGRMQFEDRLIQ
jgi:hypothetical protein